MAPPLRERRRQMLREELLTAAHTLLAEKGYAAMSMDEVAARAGVSKPTLYSYFENKDALVVATTMHQMELWLALVEAPDPAHTPLQRLVSLLRTIIQRQIEAGVLQIRPWSTEIFRLMCNDPAAVEMMRRLDAGIAALVRAAHQRGEIDPSLEVWTVVRLFYALCSTLPLARFGVLDRPDDAVIADNLGAMFERAVRAL
jgi:AcrR family transcriptional regulator